MLQEVKIQENLNIYDIANSTLGGFDNIYVGIIQQNENITSIDFDLAVLNTQSIKFDDKYFSKPTIQIQLNISSKSTKKEVLALENQSIYDLALMNYGGLDDIYKLIQDNNLVSINELNMEFKTIIFDNNSVKDLSMTKSIAKKGYVFGTIDKGKIPIFRILENGDYRILENGDYRILE